MKFWGYSLLRLFISLGLSLGLDCGYVFAKPLKVISLSPAITDWLAEFQVLLVGATEDPSADSKTKFPTSIENLGPYSRPFLEKIVRLKPDLIFVNRDGTPKDVYDRLKALHFRIEALDFSNFNSISNSLELLGKALGEDSKGRELSKQFQDQLKDLQKNCPKTHKKVVFHLGDEGHTVVGGKSFVAELFGYCGFENVFSDIDKSYFMVSAEAILKKKPDLFIIFPFGNPKDVKQDAFSIFKTKAGQPTPTFVIQDNNVLRPSMKLFHAFENIRHSLDQL